MTTFIVLAAMKGDFLAHGGNVYENFQMMGYVEADETFRAVSSFFDNPQFPIDWRDVRYMWAEPLKDDVNSGHYGDFGAIYIEDLTGSSGNVTDVDLSGDAD
jgi:hypothetical protein